VIFFAWILLMLWASRGKSRVEDSAPAYIFAASTLGLAVVLYLAYASFFVLKEVCPLCVTTYVAVIGVFVISGGSSSVAMSKLPMRALRDVRILVSTPLALVIAIGFVAASSWGMTAFPREEIRRQPQQLPAVTDDQRSELERWWDMQPKLPNFPYDNDGAKVLIVEFADFQCPHCREMYFAYQPIIDRYLESHPKDVKFVFKTYPLNSNCNPSVPGVNFVASCDASVAYLLARPKGTADKLKDWFFTHQEELSPTTVRQAAKDVGKVTDFDAAYSKAVQQIKTDASIGAALGVNSTPSFFVNGKRIPGGGVPPQYLEPLIEAELKKAK
jgi:predicted DsbA family dithiol-disulfide isomerase